MGADLYINKLYQPNLEKYKPLFEAAVQRRDSATDAEEINLHQAKVDEYYDLMYSEGYFRDSYNDSSVLWQLELSGWGDVIPMLNRRGNLVGKNLDAFIAMLENRQIPDKENLSHISHDNDQELQEWHTYFVEKRLRLIEFLKTAKQLRAPVYCSL